MLINFDGYSSRIMRPKTDEISSQAWRRETKQTREMDVKAVFLQLGKEGKFGNLLFKHYEYIISLI